MLILNIIGMGSSKGILNEETMKKYKKVGIQNIIVSRMI
jgi:hypothetical protein